MNIIIDMERMIFLRKMDNHQTLSKLCDIECSYTATRISYTDTPADFGHLSDLELKLLIKNSFGPDVRNVFSKDALLKIVHQVVADFPATTANGFEVDVQLRSIADGDTARYLYVPGASKPKPADGLAELAALQATASSATRAAMLAKREPQGTVAPAAAIAPSPTPAVAVSGDFVAPRPGTSTHSIFTFCAQAWKDAGYKDDKATLDGIKKKAVDKLVPTGLNISTVRTQAQRWYQNRQQFVI